MRLITIDSAYWKRCARRTYPSNHLIATIATKVRQMWRSRSQERQTTTARSICYLVALRVQVDVKRLVCRKCFLLWRDTLRTVVCCASLPKTCTARADPSYPLTCRLALHCRAMTAYKILHYFWASHVTDWRRHRPSTSSSHMKRVIAFCTTSWPARSRHQKLARSSSAIREISERTTTLFCIFLRPSKIEKITKNRYHRLSKSVACSWMPMMRSYTLVVQMSGVRIIRWLN